MSKGFQMINGDAVVGKTIDMVQGDEMLRQTIELVIGTNQGEWSFDELEGIERAVVLCKNPDKDEIRNTIEEAVARVDDTLTMTGFKLEIDHRRRATIEFILVKPDGAELEVTYSYAG